MSPALSTFAAAAASSLPKNIQSIPNRRTAVRRQRSRAAAPASMGRSVRSVASTKPESVSSDMASPTKLTRSASVVGSCLRQVAISS
eukprot:scaffold254275_cov28-Tisochrysis_lutea.AAC.1